MGIAKSMEDLSEEGFTVDVLHSFGSVGVDQIIDTSYKAYNAFVESFLTVLHNNLYNNKSWSIATKESWKTFFHIKYYLYLFATSTSKVMATRWKAQKVVWTIRKSASSTITMKYFVGVPCV